MHATAGWVQIREAMAKCDPKITAVAFPDEGAQKRFGKQFPVRTTTMSINGDTGLACLPGVGRNGVAYELTCNTTWMVLLGECVCRRWIWQGIPAILCGKTRIGDERQVVVQDGDPKVSKSKKTLVSPIRSSHAPTSCEQTLRIRIVRVTLVHNAGATHPDRR
jgi:hypothetical protein